MGVRDRRDQFRRLARQAVADLLDQREPFGRLALTHVLVTAGDAMFAISLAGSLFFSISPTAAQDKVVLYLLLTMAPFAVVAPALGPLVDRSRGARRALVVFSALGRAALCPFLARDVHSLLLFPEAFTMLVLSKVYLVTKGALVPEMAVLTPRPHQAAAVAEEPPAAGSEPASPAFAEADLASLNARLGLLASLSGFLFALPAIGLLKLAGSPAVLWAAMAVYAAAAVAGARLPVRRRVRAGSVAGPAVGPPGPAPAVAVAPGGFADDDWEADAADLALFRPLAHGEVLAALVPMSVLKALAGFLTFLFAFGLRREHAATWWFGILLGAITAGALVGVLLMSRLRRILTEQQILADALWALAAAAVLAGFVTGLEIQIVLAFVVGFAAAVAKPSFDALVQRYVDEGDQGRAFARFETQFQLVWVVGSFASVMLTLSLALGDLVTAAVAVVGAVSYLSGRRSLREHAPTLAADPRLAGPAGQHGRGDDW